MSRPVVAWGMEAAVTMKTRFYIAPQIWREDNILDGHYWSSLLNDFINVHIGEKFTEIDHPGRHISICCVEALDASHVSMLEDNRVYAVSPMFDSINDVSLGVQGLLLNEIPNISLIKSKLENHGIDTSWVTGESTVKQGLRFILRLFSTSQHLTGRQLLHVRNILEVPLSVTVAQIPADIRATIKKWMENNGLAIGWITGTTTVREVVYYIVSKLPFGKIKMSGVEF